jgi:restriction system protein
VGHYFSFFMAVPDYQSFMLPLLQFLSDGKEYSVRAIYDVLADQLKLSEEDRQQLLPSGQQKTYENRIGWATTHLKKACLVDKPKRGQVVINDLGLKLLAEHPEKITAKSLQIFPEYLEFCQGTAKLNSTTPVAIETESDHTPEEVLQEAYLTLRAEVADEILQYLKSSSPAFFERVVVDLLVAMGYGGSRKAAGQAIGGSGDGGVDGIISEDPLGLDNIYIQAKRWEGTVGRPTIQAFAGSLEGFRARKGVVITTSDFSKEAKDYVTRIEKKIVLINGVMLAELMLDNNVGVSEKERFVIKRIDTDYFDETQ